MWGPEPSPQSSPFPGASSADRRTEGGPLGSLSHNTHKHKLLITLELSRKAHFSLILCTKRLEAPDLDICVLSRFCKKTSMFMEKHEG